MLVGAAALAIGGAILGPKLVPSLSGPSQFVPPPGADPPATPANGTSSTPKLIMGQVFGDGDTGFQIHGEGFVPQTHVALSLSGHGTTPLSWEPVVDRKGTFNFTINEGHLFFRGTIPIGIYHVLAKDSNGVQSASTEFRVAPRPSGSPPPPRPGGRPPTGNVPPPQGLGPPPGHGGPRGSGALTF